MSKPITMLSHDRVIRECFDDETQSLRTSLANAVELAIELDHEDGDSVYAVKRSLSLPLNQEVNCAGYSKLCVFEDNAQILLSPDLEGDFWITLLPQKGQVIDICAMRVKSNVKCVIQG